MSLLILCWKMFFSFAIHHYHLDNYHDLNHILSDVLEVELILLGVLVEEAGAGLVVEDKVDVGRMD